MFPQTGDEQRSDSKAIHRVCEMVDWYARSGEPKPKQIDRLLKLRARNKMTNRETDGDIHGECAAEIHRLELALEGAADIATIAMRKRGNLGKRTGNRLIATVINSAPNQPKLKSSS
jgi:hypothetical protein